MTDTEKAALCARIDELCAEVERLRQENQSIGMAAYEVGYRNGSIHYELEHCPACKNVADLQEALAENAKLVDVLHEVEQEAIYAYNCLQQDCEAMVGGQTHFFNKWWHAECECDRAKSQNAKLTNLAKWMYQVMDMSCAVRYPHEAAPVSIQALNRAEKELQALGIEVPE